MTEGEYPDAELSVRVSGDELLRELNREFRGIDEPTDVLSFPAAEVEGDDDFPGIPIGEGELKDDHLRDPGVGDPGGSEDLESSDAVYLGDVAVSVAAAERSCAVTGMSLDRELRHLVTHGVLHLVGYDHESEGDAARMRGREVEVLGDWVNEVWEAPPTH